jgi:hypothetical protein
VVTTAAKGKKGSKLHAAVDTLGHLPALFVTPANEQERAWVAELAKSVQEATGESVDLAYVDQDYTGERPAQEAQAHGISLEVVKHPDSKRCLVLLPCCLCRGTRFRVGIAVSAVGKGLREREAAHYFGWFAHCGLRLSFLSAGDPHLGHRSITRSKLPHTVHRAFHPEQAEALRQMLHQDPRLFGKHSSHWNLGMAAEVSFEKGLTKEQVTGETVRATLARLGVRWERAKRWITCPNPEHQIKKAARPIDEDDGQLSRLLGRRFL